MFTQRFIILMLGKAAVIILIASGPSWGQALTKSDALNVLYNESAECTAYYSIGLFCEDKASSQQRATAKGAMDMAMSHAYILGMTIGKSADALNSQIGAATQSLKDQIRNDCHNISMLLPKYDERCKIITANPEVRMKELMSADKK